MRIVLLLCFGFLLGACATSEETIVIDYSKPAPVVTVQGAGNVTLSVEAADKRTARGDRVSSKMNGYGMEMAPIKPQNDIIELSRNAVERELAAQGFNIETGGVNLLIQVKTFYSQFKVGFFAGDAVAQVAFYVSIQKPDGNVVFARDYIGNGLNPNVQLALGHNAKIALDAALADAVHAVVSDNDLRQALLDSAPKPKLIVAQAGGAQN